MKKITTSLFLMWQSLLDALGIEDVWVQMAITSIVMLLGVLVAIGFGIYGLIQLFV